LGGDVDQSLKTISAVATGTKGGRIQRAAFGKRKQRGAKKKRRRRMGKDSRHQLSGIEGGDFKFTEVPTDEKGRNYNRVKTNSFRKRGNPYV